MTPVRGSCMAVRHGDADIAAAAALFGDRSRASFLRALADGRTRAANELAALAGVSRPTASSHLAKLVAAGLLDVERRGRYCLYRIAGPHVARAIEAIEVIAPEEEVRSLRQADAAASIRTARLEYDHLAGQLGVALAAALQRDEVLVERGHVYEVTAPGAERLERFGIDGDVIGVAGAPTALCCLDWSERRNHVAGPIGAALARRVMELRWCRPHPRSRALVPTEQGVRGFRDEFGIDVRDPLAAVDGPSLRDSSNASIRHRPNSPRPTVQT
jgi:DNA-binding transcriptional ArsR family regulator